MVPTNPITLNPNQYSIQFDHVYVGYGKKIILHNINLEIEKGTIVSVIGNSGAGKSTGIRCMTGQIAPKYGHAFTSGIDVHDAEAVQSQIGYIPQLEYESLYYDFSPRKNALFFGRNYGLKDEYINNRAKELMEILGLDDPKYLKTKVKKLSGGEKKRVSIMVGLISNPEILFLDEPTTGLDPHLRIEVLNFLHQINEKFGTTMLLVSHDLECVDYSNKVIIFNEGVLVDSGSPRKLIEKLPNKGNAYIVQFKSLSIKQNDQIENLNSKISFLHVGRNKYLFLPQNKKLWLDILQKFHDWDCSISFQNQIQCSFLDYFRLMSKYQYPQKTTQIKQGSTKFLENQESD